MKKSMLFLLLVAGLSTVSFGVDFNKDNFNYVYDKAGDVARETAGAIFKNDEQDKRLDGIDVENSTQNRRLDLLEKEDNKINSKLDAIEADKDALNKKAEENRVIATQAQNNVAHAMIDNNRQDKEINSMKNDLSDAKENADTALQMAGQNREDIGNLQSELGKTNSEVQANKDAIAQNKAKQDEAIKNNSNRIDTMERDFAQYDNRISSVERKVDELDDKMNKGLSLMAAMAAVDFQNIEEGEMAIGAGASYKFRVK